MTTRPRRGGSFMPDAPQHPLEQERSLELPLGYPTSAGPERIAVVLHAFHVALLPEFRGYLDNIPIPADLYVSTDTEEKRAIVAASFADWRKGGVEVRVMPNRGRDIAPKLVGFADVHDRYEYVLHLHTKSSPHESRLTGWRGYLLETLLGSPAVIHGVFEAFARASRLGMLAPQHIDALRPWIRWGGNHAQAGELARRMGFPLPHAAPLDFPSGSMFWARCAALRPLLDLRLSFDDFQTEAGQTDGTLAHAIERLYFLVCEQAGFDWLKITARGQLHEQSGVTAVAGPQDLDRFLSRHHLRLASLRAIERPIGSHPVITSPPPKPRRVSHITLRAALGEDVRVPPSRRLAIVLHGAAPVASALHRSAEAALCLLPEGVHGQILTLSGASRAAALQAGVTTGADLVLLIGAAGVLHPGSGAALLHMFEAHRGRALMEVACVPRREPQPVGQDLRLPWVGGPAIAVSRLLHDEIGGPDDSLGDDTVEQDYARRAQLRGFDVLLCPLALFSRDPVSATAGDERVA